MPIDTDQNRQTLPQAGNAWAVHIIYQNTLPRADLGAGIDGIQGAGWCDSGSGAADVDNRAALALLHAAQEDAGHLSFSLPSWVCQEWNFCRAHLYLSVYMLLGITFMKDCNKMHN